MCRYLPFLSLVLYAQAPPSFEVASVKPAAPLSDGQRGFSVRGGPGSSDPGLATFTNIDLFSLVAMAYGIQRHQLSAPDWLNTARFDIVARAGPATPDEYRLMLQTLLSERFKLAVHRQQRELQMYELEVTKGGAKLKKLPPEDGDAREGLKPPPPWSSPPLGYQGAVNVAIAKGTMERLASVLSGLLGEPVVNNTGLAGDYEIKLRALIEGHATDATNQVPDIFSALQEQLGLKLVRKKELLDVLVIDHIEKTPTEN